MSLTKPIVPFKEWRFFGYSPEHSLTVVTFARQIVSSEFKRSSSVCEASNSCFCFLNTFSFFHIFSLSFKSYTVSRKLYLIQFTVSVASLKSCWAWSSSRLAGVVGKVKMLLTLETSVWFPLPSATQGEVVLANL